MIFWYPSWNKEEDLQIISSSSSVIFYFFRLLNNKSQPLLTDMIGKEMLVAPPLLVDYESFIIISHTRTSSLLAGGLA